MSCEIRNVFTVEHNGVFEKYPLLVNVMPLKNGYLAAVLPFQYEIKPAVYKLVTQSSHEPHYKDEDGNIK